MKNTKVAFTPPMGWNSWDCFGASVTEDEVKQNAQYMAENLLRHGWEYVVVDIQWYEPNANSSIYRPFADLNMDEFGRLLPAENRFPSAAQGKGFRPLADYVHQLGLKFGIHIMRGIPRQAVSANTAILGSQYHARDIAHPYSICPWNTDMYGVDAQKPGAQEYYDSLLSLYSAWGVDFIKVDDISYTSFGVDPYAGKDEIELIHHAIKHCGRDIVLSLSCGPAPFEHAQHLANHSHMWRLTADLWDRWQDINAMFDTCAKWAPYCGEGQWPDADMLPLGHIALRSAEHGAPERYCQLTRDEQRTMMTLWCIAKSPLMVGAHLPDNDAETLNLLTNDEVLAVNQTAHSPRQLLHSGFQRHSVLWRSEGVDGQIYLAVFNTMNIATHIAVGLDTLGLTGKYHIRDLWERRDCGMAQNKLDVELPCHGCILYSLTAAAPVR